MTFSFADLKKNKSKFTEELKEEVKSASNKPKSFEKEEDTRFWQPVLDEGGKGSAIIRFLPPTTDKNKGFIKKINYGFQGPAGDDGSRGFWYIENSLQTIGQEDPVQKYNNLLWAKSRTTGNKIYENQAKQQKKNVFFISNILVIKDRKNPENEGKVFLFRYGQKVFGKIEEKLFPTFDGDEPINIFDFWTGANFKVVISLNKTGEKEYRNWDASHFDNSSELFDGDEDKLKELYSKQYNLEEFIAPTEFKPYDELLAKLERTMRVEPGQLLRGEDKPTKSRQEIIEDLDDSLDHIIEPELKTISTKTKKKVDADDDISFFNNILNGDDS